MNGIATRSSRRQAERAERDSVHASETQRPPHRLILCFDGTGNDYQARPNDTNIIKLLEMFDRSCPNQMHYYQPGIGTYTADSSVNQNWFNAMKSKFSKAIDSGFGTSFDHHVMAGYRFLMRYHMEGDQIYIFGFSRGAFTARFLARMVAHVGLLSMGNEEMVPFAFKLYQDYEMNAKNWAPYMIRFRNAFCRHRSDSLADLNKAAGGFHVHFLGLFDTVGSVGTLDRGTVSAPAVLGTSKYVRHAVAIDERRVKFKAALLAQDRNERQDENIKEVWFPGNHGDVGGGWSPDSMPEKPPGFFRRFAQSWSLPDLPEPQVDTSKDAFQLSDIALKWMISELDAVEDLEQDEDPSRERLQWSEGKDNYLSRYSQREALKGKLHDTMALGGGSKLGKVFMWNFMEYLPGIWRREYYAEPHRPWWYRMLTWWRKSEDRAEWPKWEKTYFPLNMGGCRDLPVGTLVHHALIERLKKDAHYKPNNDVIAMSEERKEQMYKLHWCEHKPVKAGKKGDKALHLKERAEFRIGKDAEDMIYSLEIK